MKARHLKVTNPVRFFIFIFISVMIMIFAGYSILSTGQAEAAAAKTYAKVTIQENDTLWDLVEIYNPDVNISYRDIIHEICESNDIDVNNLYPGDVVYIPVY